MPGRIIYLEIDDEITSAAARIRASEASRLAVVLPYGSRVATSRINFRLLSRDALTHEKRLSIVAADSATRALAASAGLPVFASVAEYESSLAGLEPDDDPRAATGVPVVGPATSSAMRDDAVPDPPTGTAGDTAAPSPRPAESDGSVDLAVPAVAMAAAAGGPPGDTIRSSVPLAPDRTYDRRPAVPAGGRGSGGGARPVARGAAGGRIRTPWIIGGAILALAALVGGVGAYLLLPSATIVVTPKTEPVGPIEMRVVADTAAAAPDPAIRVVPAQEISIPVSVSDTFSATGKRVELTKATGTVRFDNLDPTSTNRIVAGSIVRSGSGVRFRTQVTITVPRAELVGLTIFPARASVKVTAVAGGPDGNVDAGTIVVVPSGENSLFLKVTNPAATSGGSSTEFTRVTQGDVDAALAALNLSLSQAFSEAMADPALESGGATVFPSTGQLGEPTPDVPPETLVGQEVATFALSLSATGTVIAVDAAPVSAIADTQLRSAVEADHRLVAGSVDIEVGDALIIGQSITFPVSASAQQVAVLDPDELTTMVLGKPVPEAQSILEQYGQVEIAVSPDWTGSVPSFESRVSLTIDQAVQIETPIPTSSSRPTNGSQPTRPTTSPAPTAKESATP